MTSMSFHGGNISGEISPPPSKSHSHRAFMLASMAKGRSRVDNALMSDDIVSTIGACRAMGATIEILGDHSIVDGGNLHAPVETVDVGNSGTTMRIYAGLSSMFSQEVRLDGDESIRKRPMGPLLDALGQAGVQCCSNDGLPPVTVKGPSRGGDIRINGGVSSQYISALLMVSPMLDSDSRIIVEGNMVSAPYLDVTTRMMGLFGAEAERNGNVFTVKGGTGYTPYDYTVPADFSSAAFPLVAGALGGEVTVRNLDMDDPQGDRMIVDVLRKAGAEVEVRDGSITVRKRELKGCRIDMGSIPDLFPITAILLSTAEGDSELHGAPQLKYKESNRIETVVNMIKNLGGDAEPTDEGCIIHGRPRLVGGRVAHKGDHRIMMSAAVASVVCDEAVVMDDAECCNVSFPGFPEKMAAVGLNHKVI